MRFRGKSVRRKIVALLLVPLLLLTAVWGVATVWSARQAVDLLHAVDVVEKIAVPLQKAAGGIQRERRQTLIHLADPTASDALSQMHERRLATDKLIADIRANAENPDIGGDMNPRTQSRLKSVMTAFEDIASTRNAVDQNNVTRGQALGLYNELIDPCYQFLMTIGSVDDVELAKQGRALIGATRAREMLAREDALLASALVARRIDSTDLRGISDLVAQRRTLYDTVLLDLPAAERADFESFWSGARSRALRETEDRVIKAGPSGSLRATSAERWDEAVTPVLDEMSELNGRSADLYQERVTPVAMEVFFTAAAAGVLGLLALLFTVLTSVRIGRRLVRDLTGLRQEAHEAADVRLPEVLRRLAAGEQVDVETEAPRLEYGPGEIGQVGQALNSLQRAAVEGAVRQADLRRGISEVFVNLARRSQVLLHRQLTLLDTMERRTEDTEELADLFRLDHLTTRMRRHAEGLVILSGAAPSRQWRKPVQLMDVVRAAVAEVEDYERVEVRRLPRIAVGGGAVADLTHLVAELLENATVFSPPHTAVQVVGEPVANGFTLEIHDRGLGMAPESLLDANRRLSESPDLELSETDRLGLFVVSRLARRQDVRVSLQPSPYGGTTAVVLIPDALLTEPGPRDGDSDGRGLALDDTGSHPLPALASVPRGADGPDRRPADRPALDGPVEIEAPVGTVGLGPAGLAPPPGNGADHPLGLLDDEDSERGSIFRARRRAKDHLPRKNGFLMPTSPAPARPTGPVAARPTADDGAEQHQQAGDLPVRTARPARPQGGPTPLPRRRAPQLVAHHGRPVASREEPDAAPRPPDGPDAEDARAEGPRLPSARGGGLPRRVRQASIAPQLKTGPDHRGDRPQADPPEPADDRDADEVRSRMASLQRGWQRGRAENEQHPGETGQDRPAPPGADTPPDGLAVRGRPGTRPTPRTTPEGNGR
ncbi:nitrate- and nitrite sensing domain-containing protein [Streptomyces sp. NPDC060194]|uniref:sensor histidine kinase n=1 Tax=Streptomyces sp. NPDC060194 TaxID=3347069 RepID=UPI00365EFFB7